MAESSRFDLVEAEDRIIGPFDSLALEGKLYDKARGRMIDVRLSPMGGTVLRQVSFDPAEQGMGE